MEVVQPGRLNNRPATVLKRSRQPTPDCLPLSATEAQSGHYYDAAVTFDIADRFQFIAGVNNLFDTKPSLVGSQQVQANADPSLYDTLGRRFFATVSAKLFGN